MFELYDWIVDSQYFKKYRSIGPEYMSPAFQTRSEPVAGQGWHRQNAFSAFAWKI